MCQCHTMWESEGDMQVQVAHSKKIPLGEKKFLHGVPAFFSGVPPEGGGGTEKNFTRIFSTPPGHIHPHRHPQHPHHHGPRVQVRPIHVQVRVPMEGTVFVFKSKIVANARVHACIIQLSTIPSMHSFRYPNATCVQTSAQYMIYRNHEHHCTPFADQSKSFDR